MKANLYNLNLKFKNTFKSIEKSLQSTFDKSDFILGNKVTELEEKISNYTSTLYISCVGNGTDALIFSLKYLSERNPNKKNVITTPLSYLASTSSIILTGLNPIFCDIDNSLNLDPNKVEETIDENTLAVLFVHYSGNPTNIDKIRKICENYNIFLIEDCAQSFGSKLNNEFSGKFGFSGCVSLHPLKTLSCAGDGGFIMTQDHNFKKYLNYARNHGHKNRDDVEFWSFNSRLDSLQAAITLDQFSWFIEELKVRRAQYLIYKKQIDSKFFPRIDINAEHSFNWLVLLIDNRSDLQAKLFDNNIETKIHYPKLINEMKPYKEIGFTINQNLKYANNVSKKILSLPIGSHLSDDVILYICDLIKKFSD